MKKKEKGNFTLFAYKFAFIVFLIIFFMFMYGCVSLFRSSDKETKNESSKIVGTTTTTSYTFTTSSKVDYDKIVSTYVINTNTKVAHTDHCSYVRKGSKNMRTVEMSAEELKSKGYLPCSRCRPF